MDQWITLGVLLAGWVILAPIVGIVALARLNKLEREIRQLRAAGGAAPTVSEPAATQPTAAPSAAKEAAAARVTPPPQTTKATPPPPPPPRPPQPKKPAWWREQNLTSVGMVLLGAVTLAVAALFLVGYAIEQGWFGPLARIASGVGLGLLLVAGGEWTRRRPAAPNQAGVVDYVPQALTAAGLFACFASVYAAHALYGLIGPIGTFAILAALVFFALSVALLHGPFTALLGLAAGYLTPILIETAAPNAWALFLYLFALTAASMGLVRYVASRWLAWSAFAGATLWVLLWFEQVSDWPLLPADQWVIPVGLYLIGLAILFQLIGFPTTEEDADAWTREKDLTRRLDRWLTIRRALMWGMSLAIAGLMFVMAAVADWSWPAIAMLALLVVWYFCLWAVASRRRGRKRGHKRD